MVRFGSILFVFLLATLLSSNAQQYVLTNYSLDKGLPQSSILDIYQDSFGNIWFGTQGGVSKFNGHTFENFDSRHGLAGNHITTMIQDHQGRYWFGHRYKGISMLQQKSFVKLELTEARINCIAEDEKGNIWFGTHGNGLFMLPADAEPATENFIPIPLIEDISEVNVYALIFSNGYMFAGTNLGLVVVEQKAGNRNATPNVYTPENSFLPVRHLFSFTEVNGETWGLTEQGLVQITNKGKWTSENTVLHRFPGDPDVYFLMNIDADAEGTIWGVHSKGIYRFSNGEFDFSFRGTNYEDNETNTLFIDREENVWIGTMNMGALKFTSDKFQIFNTGSGLISNVVTSVIEDRNGHLWVATEGGVCRYDGEKYTYFDKSNRLPDNSVQVLFEDSRGNIWMGYYDGLPILRYNPETNSFRRFSTKDGFITNSVITIAEDQKGDIWFATLGFGVSRYSYPEKGRREKVETFTRNDGLCSNSFWIIHTDRKGNLWFGSDNEGLSMYDGYRFYTFNEKDGLDNPSPAAITNDRKNNLWIASIGGGVYKFDGRNFFNYSIDEGLSSDSPFSIVCDDNDVVWVGTNFGIDRFDPQTKTFKSYGREDGFLGIENNQNAVCKGKDGVIWFGTMNGVVRFNPEKDVSNAHPPVAMIENIQLFFNPFDFSEYADSVNPVTGIPSNLALKHRMNHLTFQCIGISHRSPQKIKYQYFLEHFDTEWNPLTDATSITYTNLPPGEYVFKVRAFNNDGIANAEAVRLPVTIYPPFWLTWWFRIATIVFLLAVVYAFFRYRLKSIKSQKKKLERLVSEKTLELKHEAEERKAAQLRAEESDKLKTAFLANMSHEIRTPVNAIIGFSDLLRENDLEEEERETYLEYIIGGGRSLMNLINDIIDISKIEAGEIRIAKESCRLDEILGELHTMFNELIRKKGKEKVQLVLEKPEIQIDSEVLTDPFRLKQILSNLLNNAVKFTDSGSITFGYAIQDEAFLKFFVKDTGIGIPRDKQEVIFHRFRQVEDAHTRNYDGTGLGLTISQKLTKLIGGEMWLESEEGKGALFSFTVPFEINGSKEKYLKPKGNITMEESLKGKQILVVEDEDSNYILIQNLLRDAEVNIMRAVDGEKAVDVFRKNGRQIDLVLMDIKIPRLNGYDATRQIKRLKPGIPIVAQTAYAMPDEKQNCLDAGCNDYIAKPYNKQELMNIIQKNLATCHSYY
jgi:signal transduction histidine kinase/ligand-binding sensor domain-containing protein/CheY-like chemotaxis protein